MIYLKTDQEVELMRLSNDLLGRTLAEVAKVIRPGVTTAELDKVAYEFICDLIELCSSNPWSDDLGDFRQGSSEQVVTAAQELNFFFSLEVDHFD